MKSTLCLIGLSVVVGAGLTLADGPDAQAPPASAPASKPAAPAASATTEDKALLEPFHAFVKAYDEGNAEALAALFTEDAAVIDSSGAATRGRQAISAMYAHGFAEVSGLKIEPTLETVRQITTDVVRVEGRSRLSGGGAGGAVEISRFSALAVRRDGKWAIAELRDDLAPQADVTPYDRLRELEWMIGDWVDESANVRVSSSVRWADNQSFLVRTYSVEVPGEPSRTGTMFIGWDPQTGQVKSWLFDSAGGHGEGLWTRAAEDQWVVKARGVLRDGSPTSATQIHTILNKDSVKTDSIDRIIGGRIAPDITEVVMVRQPPPPAGAEGPAPAQPAAGARK